MVNQAVSLKKVSCPKVNCHEFACNIHLAMVQRGHFSQSLPGHKSEWQTDNMVRHALSS